MHVTVSAEQMLSPFQSRTFRKYLIVDFPELVGSGKQNTIPTDFFLWTVLPLLFLDNAFFFFIW